MRRFSGIQTLLVSLILISGFYTGVSAQSKGSSSLHPDYPLLHLTPDSFFYFQQPSARRGSTFSIPIVMPLEASLGKLVPNDFPSLAPHLVQIKQDAGKVRFKGFLGLAEERSPLFRRDRYLFPNGFHHADNSYPFTNQDREAGKIRALGFSMAYSSDKTYLQIDVSRNREDYYGRRSLPGDSLKAALIIGYGLGSHSQNGIRSGVWPLSLTLGVTSRYIYAGSNNLQNLKDTGEHFFTPGFSVFRNSFQFWANVELPINDRLKLDIPQDSPYHERVRGTIGLKYYLR